MLFFGHDAYEICHSFTFYLYTTSLADSITLMVRACVCGYCTVQVGGGVHGLGSLVQTASRDFRYIPGGHG